MVTQLVTQATGNRRDLRIKIFHSALTVTSWAAAGDALFAAGGWSSGRSMSLNAMARPAARDLHLLDQQLPGSPPEHLVEQLLPVPGAPVESGPPHTCPLR